MKLNIGCGRVIVPGFVNADLNPIGDGVVKADLDARLPWDDATFDFVRAHHVLEHVQDRGHAFGEIARVLKPGGLLEARTPYGVKGLYFVWHRWAFNEFTYIDLCNADERCAQYGDGPDFEIVELRRQKVPPFLWHIRKYVPWAEKYLNRRGARGDEMYAMLRRTGVSPRTGSGVLINSNDGE